MESNVLYFDRPCRINTDDVLRIAKERAEKLKIRNVIVASDTGETGLKAVELFRGYNVVVVAEATGYKRPGLQPFTEEMKKQILKLGGKIFIGTHALSAVERSARNKFNTYLPLELMAHTLRLFGNGTKVCVEIAVMACDAGYVPVTKSGEYEEVISIGGTGRGADTALVIKPDNFPRFFDIEIREIIAKPRNLRVRDTV